MEISITAYSNLGNQGGPSVPMDHGARTSLFQHGKLKGVDRLSMLLGDATINVWLLEPDKVRALGEKLIKIADEVEQKWASRGISS